MKNYGWSHTSRSQLVCDEVPVRISIKLRDSFSTCRCWRWDFAACLRFNHLSRWYDRGSLPFVCFLLVYTAFRYGCVSAPWWRAAYEWVSSRAEAIPCRLAVSGSSLTPSLSCVQCVYHSASPLVCDQYSAARGESVTGCLWAQCG